MFPGYGPAFFHVTPKVVPEELSGPGLALTVVPLLALTMVISSSGKVLMLPDLDGVATAELLLVHGANWASGYRPLAVLSPPGASAIHSALVSAQAVDEQVKLCVKLLAGVVTSVILTVY
jgi:hypothetical protein